MTMKRCWVYPLSCDRLLTWEMGLLYSWEVGLCMGNPARVVLLKPTGPTEAWLYAWPQGSGVSPEKLPRPWAEAEVAEKTKAAKREAAKNLFMTEGILG